MNENLEELIAVAKRGGDLWTPKRVEEELVEAARVISWITGRVGPKGYGSGIPNEMVEAMSAPTSDGETLWWDRESSDARALRLAIPARKVSVSEFISAWPGIYLRHYPAWRRVLLVYLRCKVYRRPFVKACEARGWPLSTGKWTKNKALATIAQGLNATGVQFEQVD